MKLSRSILIFLIIGLQPGTANAQLAINNFAGQIGLVGHSDGVGTNALFNDPVKITSDPFSGNLFVADFSNNTIRKILMSGEVSTFAGQYGNSNSLDGIGTNAFFNGPTGIAADSGGNLYVSDIFDETIRKITPGGVVITIAGSAGLTGTNDGINATARFNAPRALTLDANSNIYLVDLSNNIVREIVASGTNWITTTIAGKAGFAGSADGQGQQARFNSPKGIVTDNKGDLFVADQGNQTVREVSPNGTNWVVMTIAGKTGVAGDQDGIGTNALFTSPTDIAIDVYNNLYVTDQGNGIIRKISLNGTNWMVTTLARPGGSPRGITISTNGVMYVSDGLNMIILSIVTNSVLPATISIDPRATYLFTYDDIPDVPTPFNLGALGIVSGDILMLKQSGDFTNGNSGFYHRMLGLFSSNTVLLADNQTVRVPGAILAGKSVVTPVTYHGNYATDISQDFEIFSTNTAVRVPAGANYLYITALDNLYGDNTDDPANRFTVQVARGTESFLTINTSPTNQIATLSWNTDSNQWYQLQSASVDLSVWINVGTPVLGSGLPAAVQDNFSGQNNKFYRVVRTP